MELKQKYGDNELSEKEKDTWFTILVSQFKSPLIYLLIAVGSLSFYFKETLDTLLIALVVVFNIVTGYIQEYSAHKTLSALKKIIKSKSTVLRGGQRMEIESKDLVPGDIVILSSGDKIPADGVIIKGTNILINEAILTGEEEAVAKTVRNNENSVYMGTTVVSGQCLIRIEKIGKDTKVGKIGLSLSDIEETDTPLQKRLKAFTKNLILIVIVVCALIFLIELANVHNLLETIKLSIVLSIAAIPEGLPVAITVILAMGMRRILGKKGLVKKLVSIETLGSTSTICLDKTGTLTEGVMQVVKTSFTDSPTALLGLTLLNDRRVGIELAIWNFLKKESKENPDNIFAANERISEEPFDSSKKYKAVINKVNDRPTLFVMGAPDILVNFCKLPAGKKTEIEEQIKDWAGAGLRLIGTAYKEQGELTDKKDLIWLGLVGIEDPVRAEAKEVLAEARSAGINIKIVTGDFRLTAEHLAKKIGLELSPESVMDFEQLEEINSEELKGKIDKINLFTRVTPIQKLKIIEALQARGEIVAMTGDGVNDAPALKKADIGIVVENGTDVAKEAGDLILLDSNFKTIMAACEEGRLILANIKKVVGYVLSNSFAEIVLIVGSILLHLPIPLTIAQILWIHLICDGPPDIMLSFEPKEKDLMKMKPQEIRNEEILSPVMKLLIVTISITVGVSALYFFGFYYGSLGDINLARTIAFAILASVSLVYIFAFKNLHKTIIQTENLLENKYLIISVLYGFILIFLAIYVPALNKILTTTPLSLMHWGIVLSVSFLTLLIVEFSKIVVTKVFKGASI